MRHKGVLKNSDIEDQKNKVHGKQNVSASSGDFTQVLLDTMREVTQSNKFCHRNDLWTTLQRKMTNDQF